MGCHVFRGPSSCQKRLHCMQRIGKRRTEKAEAGHSSRPDPRPTAIRHSELSRAENSLRLLESIPVPRLHSSPLSGALASLCSSRCSRGPAGGASRRGPSFMRQPEGRGSLERVGGMGAGAVSGSAHPVFSRRRRLVFKDVINGCVSVAPREEAKKDCHVGIPFCHRRTHGAENDGRSFTT